MLTTTFENLTYLLYRPGKFGLERNWMASVAAKACVEEHPVPATKSDVRGSEILNVIRRRYFKHILNL
jgi:hypothetical protein